MHLKVQRRSNNIHSKALMFPTISDPALSWSCTLRQEVQSEAGSVRDVRHSWKAPRVSFKILNAWICADITLGRSLQSTRWCNANVVRSGGKKGNIEVLFNFLKANIKGQSSNVTGHRKWEWWGPLEDARCCCGVVKIVARLMWDQPHFCTW